MAYNPKNFYNRNFPVEGEIVRIIMTNMNDTAVDCILPDFNNKNGIILLADLSHQKRYRKGRSSIRNYFYKDKVVCAKIITADEKKQSIILTRKYQTEWKEKAKKLILGNNRLITIVNTITRKLHNEINQEYFDTTWKELIYPLINNINKTDHEEQIIIYNFIESNIDTFNIPKKYEKLFLESIKKYTKKPDQKYKSRFGLISINGIEHTKNIFQKLTNEINIKNDKITYDGESGYWKLTTLNSDISEAEKIHNNFICKLKEEIANKKFHIKVDYISKV